MSVMLSTTNPQVAERLQQGVEVGPVAPAATIPGWGTGAVPEAECGPPGEVEVPAPVLLDDYGQPLDLELDAVAIEEIAELEREAAPPPTPLPALGSLVGFRLRAGDFKNRRNAFPALVIAANEAERTLNIIVMIDINDGMQLEVVREAADGEPGWFLTDATLHVLRVEEMLRQVIAVSFGQNIVSTDDPSLYDRLSDLYERVAAVEGRGGVTTDAAWEFVRFATQDAIKSVTSLVDGLNSRIQVIEGRGDQVKMLHGQVKDLGEALKATNATLRAALDRLQAVEGAQSIGNVPDGPAPALSTPAAPGRRRRGS